MRVVTGTRHEPAPAPEPPPERDRRAERTAEREAQGLTPGVTAPAGLRRLAYLLREAERRARG